MKDEQKIFTDREASEFLRISQVSLWRLRKAGKLPYRRVTSKIIYLRQDLDEYLESTRRGIGGKGRAND